MNGLQIDPDRYYEECELRQFGGVFSGTALRRGRASGLRYKETARGRRVYKGAWLLAWLNEPEPAEPCLPSG